MSIISVPNLKEIEKWEGYFTQLKYMCNFVQKRRRKMWRKSHNFQEQISQEVLKQFLLIWYVN